ncbi:MAG: PA14 domain-containing protein [Clostridia bacterium]|nr:PA14 domain-containing protein [Clostridia bacterium]
MRRTLPLTALLLMILAVPAIMQAAHSPLSVASLEPGLECVWALQKPKGPVALMAWWTDDTGAPIDPGSLDGFSIMPASQLVEASSGIAMYDAAGNLLHMVTIGTRPEFTETPGVADTALMGLVWNLVRDANGTVSEVSIAAPDGTPIGSIEYTRDATANTVTETWRDAKPQVRASVVCHYDSAGRLASRILHVPGEPHSTYEEFVYMWDQPEATEAVRVVPIGAPHPGTRSTRYYVNTSGLITAAEVTDSGDAPTEGPDDDNSPQPVEAASAARRYEYSYLLDSSGNWIRRDCQLQVEGGDSQETVETIVRTIAYYSPQDLASASVPASASAFTSASASALPSAFSGRVVDPSGAAIEGVSIALQADSAPISTSADGGWRASEFTITPAKEGWAFVPEVLKTSRAADDMGFIGTYSASGRVTDENGQAVEGVAISFTNGWPAVATGSDGRWTISGLHGQIVASPYKKGWRFSPSTQSLEGPSRDSDFAGELVQFTASGCIVNPSDIGVDGILLELSSPYSSATSDTFGYWQQDDLEGSVVVRPSSQWFTFTPSQAVVTKQSPEAVFTATHRVLCDYFNYDWLFGSPSVAGTPAVTRWEDKFSHSWGSGNPAPAINSNCFSARFTAQVPLNSGAYEFTVVSDDGARMWIDGTLVVDAWYAQDDGRHVARRHMSQGVHKIEIHYFERWGEAYLNVEWKKQ